MEFASCGGHGWGPKTGRKRCPPGGFLGGRARGFERECLKEWSLRCWSPARSAWFTVRTEALTLDPKEVFRSMFRLIPETGIPSAAKAAPPFCAFVSRVKPFAGTPGEYLG